MAERDNLRLVLAASLGGASLLALAGCGQPKPAAIAEAEKLIPEKVDYNWDVRPILSQNCFACHGNDPAKREAGLRLDIQKVAYGPLPENKKARAVVPRQPMSSEMIRRILSDDPDVRMPPVDSHKTLSARDKAVLWRWIEQGAKYEEHWAYIAPKAARAPKSGIQKAAVNPIDNFVYARMEQAELKPSPEADRETLINRVTLDLTGLPPTLAEVDAFLADKSPNAYEKLVDRLLASPAYGERMATYWMDVARYGESDGYLDDNYGRLIYPWRDWAISAFNRNIPYDQFVTWQLAGDLLPNRTREQLLATAFARVGKRSTENGIIDEEYRVEYRNERSELVGKAFLGLTVGCAKCHDHKYDVISQKDYYSLAGFFNSIDERGFYAMPRMGSNVGPTLPWPTPEQQTAWTKARTDMAAKEAAHKAAVAGATKAAAPRIEAMLKQSPQVLAGALKGSVEKATLAYYPFEETYSAPFDAIKTMPFGGQRPPAPPGAAGRTRPPGAPRGPGPAGPARDGLQRAALTAPAAGGQRPTGAGAPTPEQIAAFRARAAAGGAAGGPPRGAGGAPTPEQIAALRARGAAGAPPGAGGPPRRPAAGVQGGVGGSASLARPTQPMIPSTLRAEKLIWTRAGRPEEPGAVLENAKLIAGARGKAFLVDDSVGFLGPRDVARIERNEEVSLDLWVRPRADKPYESAPIVFQQDHNVGGGDSGYRLVSEKDKLRFDVIHMSPNNMVSVITAKPVPRGQWTHVAVTYDGSSKAEGARIFINGQPAEVEVVRDNLTRSSKPSGRFGSAILGGGYWGLAFGKRFRSEEFNKGAIDELRVFDRKLTPAEAAWLHNPGGVGGDKASVRESLLQLAVEADPSVQQAKAALREAREAENQIATKIQEVMVLGETPKPRPTHLLTAGLYDTPAEEVQPQGLQRVFKWKASLPRNRLGMTEWLFDKKNPLTSRVFVNRMWMLHFGSGIVETVEDFGTQGSNPSNPELLDWLAVEFIRSGWDMKHMHRLMVTSATYRQSSKLTAELAQKDPRNVLLARGPRYRLPAETIRDNALFASGLLVDKKGGDSVFPYQPDGVWTAGAGFNRYPTEVPDDNHHRRSMYTFIKRASQAPSLTVFDQADRSVSTVQRRISNTPLQALVLLNDVQYLEAYRKLAERAITASPDRDRQIETVFRLSTRRRPLPAEMAALRRYYGSEIDRLGKAPDAVDKLLAQGVAPVGDKVDRVQLAALAMVTGAVMNSPDAYTLR